MLNNRLIVLGMVGAVLLCCAVEANAVIPGSTTLQPSDDADGEYIGAGDWSLFVPQDAVLVVRLPSAVASEERAAMEFDIGVLPSGAVVTAATLKLMSSDPNAMIGLYGYAGDGAVTWEDLVVQTWIISFDHHPGLNEVDVTGFVQSLVSSSESYAGFTLREEAADHFAIFRSMESAFPPELVIEYVPEPATLALLLLAGLVVLRHRRSA